MIHFFILKVELRKLNTVVFPKKSLSSMATFIISQMQWMLQFWNFPIFPGLRIVFSSDFYSLEGVKLSICILNFAEFLITNHWDDLQLLCRTRCSFKQFIHAGNAEILKWAWVNATILQYPVRPYVFSAGGVNVYTCSTENSIDLSPPVFFKISDKKFPSSALFSIFF